MFVAWNVRGLSSREKWLKITNWLNDLQADIPFLHEIHTV